MNFTRIFFLSIWRGNNTEISRAYLRKIPKIKGWTHISSFALDWHLDFNFYLRNNSTTYLTSLFKTIRANARPHRLFCLARESFTALHPSCYLILRSGMYFFFPESFISRLDEHSSQLTHFIVTNSKTHTKNGTTKPYLINLHVLKSVLN